MIYVTLIAFNRTEVVESAMENFIRTTTVTERAACQLNVFDPGYPLPSADINQDKLIPMAERLGWRYTAIPNEGVMGNHNRIIHEYCRMQPGDFYVCFDGDVRMREPGWLSASVEALQSDPDVVFVCPSRDFHVEAWCSQQHGRCEYRLPSGLRVAKYESLIAWSMGVFKGEFLASRPRDFNTGTQTKNPFYGYPEHADYERMLAMKKTWRQLVTFHDDHLGSPDLEYTEWKIACANQTTLLKFEDWLKPKGR